MSTAPPQDAAFVVLKFGGTSVARADRWRTIAGLAQARLDEGLRPLLVCSALSGVSDRLVALVDAALAGRHRSILGELHHRHMTLANSLGIDVPEAVLKRLDLLGRIADGIELVQEVSPRLRARVLASGELMSTHLGVAFLAAQGLDAAWVDARDWLSTTDADSVPEVRRTLSASCEVVHSPQAAAGLAQLGSVLVTQGFIARQPDTGHTALLGRGGSDTSAALFAALVGARRCEIWTDVPGLFTTNPRQVPSARLLRRLDYAEAQELASTGAKVLHPRCLPPVQAYNIPLSIHCTPRPQLEGTTITAVGEGGPGLKAVSSRGGVTLVSMETVGMWQQPGFLAKAFSVIAENGLSVDLVATSETSVTVTLDPGSTALDRDGLARVQAQLGTFCEATVTEGLAAVSLVGRGIRRILHRLAPVLELFEEQRIYLLSQAANDLNLTVVVDPDQADRLLQQLHGALLGEVDGASWLGPSWTALTDDRDTPEPTWSTWWSDRRDDLLAVASEQTPVYVYAGDQVDAAATRLADLEHADAVLYAMKANFHPGLLARIVAAGLGVECVSPGEVRRGRAALDAAGSSAPLLFTPNFASRDDYVVGFELGAHVTLDNLHPLQHWPEVFAGREVFVRLDPGGGAGHHAKVRTAGSRSKFGISADQLPELVGLCADHNVRVVGVHAHVGSGVRDPHAWGTTGARLASLIAEHFADTVRVVDVGGGLGVPEKSGQASLDLALLDGVLGELKHELPPGCAVWIEPGRYLVAEAGVLLTTVTQLKEKGEVRYVGVDAGMHSLLRPALYGAYHHIVNLSRLDGDEALVEVEVVGPICETGDVLGRGRRLHRPREGDVVLVATAGAYGRSMASDYNLRGLPEEVVLEVTRGE